MKRVLGHTFNHIIIGRPIICIPCEVIGFMFNCIHNIWDLKAVIFSSRCVPHLLPAVTSSCQGFFSCFRANVLLINFWGGHKSVMVWTQLVLRQCVLLPAKFPNRYVLYGGIQRRALSFFQSRGMNIFNCRLICRLYNEDFLLTS